MNCRDFQEIIDSYLSDELLTETNHDILRHLEDCVNCRKVIEARREVRGRLRNAVLNAPQYQIGKNFTHSLRTHLKHEALRNEQTKSTSWFNFGSWAAVAAGLVLVFTFGFILLNNSNKPDAPTIASEPHMTTEFPQSHIVNAAFSDHEYCAIEYDLQHPVRLAKTPVKYEKFEQIAISQIKEILAGYELKKSHTCEYENTDFTHLVLVKGNQTVSLMLTKREKTEKFSENISFSTSNKYESARFDVGDTAVFVISGLDRKMNFKIADTLYDPLQKYLTEENDFQTTLLMTY